MCGFAGDESLAGRRRLAAVGRDRGIAGDEIEAIDGSAQRVGADLSDDRVRALSDIHRALVKRNSAVGFQSHAHGGRIGQGSVAAAVPHAGNADAAPDRAAGFRIERRQLRRVRLSTCGRNASKQARIPTPSPSTWPVTVGVSIVQRIQDAEFQPIDPQPVSEIVVKLFLRDRRLRNAETAESSGRHQMRVHRPGQRAIVRNVVWSRGVDRNARRHRRSPGGVGAGIEIGGEVHRRQLAVASRARAQANAAKDVAWWSR